MADKFFDFCYQSRSMHHPSDETSPAPTVFSVSSEYKWAMSMAKFLLLSLPFLFCVARVSLLA